MSFLDSIPGVSAASDFFGAVLDITLWRSLGWIALGIILMIIGVVALIKPHIPAVPVPL